MAIWRFMSGTQRSKRCSGSVAARASATMTFWSFIISICASRMELGGRICQRAIFACMRFWPARITPSTVAMAALTFFWIMKPATMLPRPNESTPKNVLQP